MTEAEKKELTDFATLFGKLPPPSDPTSGGAKSRKPIAQASIQLQLPEFDPKHLPQCRIAEFPLLTCQYHVEVATKCSLLKHSCKRKYSQK